jgi:C1A family cysteine protease
LLAFRFMKTNGITTADKYPYIGRQGRCVKASSSDVGVSAVREILNGNESRLKDIVAMYGPVAVAIHSARTLTNYRSGVYTNPKCPKVLNHAVVLCGYGTDAKTKLDYWLVKNSWVILSLYLCLRLVEV